MPKIQSYNKYHYPEINFKCTFPDNPTELNSLILAADDFVGSSELKNAFEPIYDLYWDEVSELMKNIQYVYLEEHTNNIMIDFFLPYKIEKWLDRLRPLSLINVGTLIEFD